MLNERMSTKIHTHTLVVLGTSYLSLFVVVSYRWGSLIVVNKSYFK